MVYGAQGIWLYTLGSVLAISLVSILGILTLLRRQRGRRRSLLLVSFATGGLLGDALVHLLPTAFHQYDADEVVSLLCLLGIFSFFVLEKLLRARSHGTHIRPLVIVNLVGDGLHNLVDGMIIGASYTAGTRLGLATTLAVVLHEIPQELGDFGILVHGGLSVKKALLLNLLSALTALLGAIFILLAATANDGLVRALLPVTAGGFMYIAGSDLIPELNRVEATLRPSAAQLLFMALGVAVMTALTLLE